jgi:hypothetical protein
LADIYSEHAYKIANNNFFKLRDVGKAFDYDVSWNNEAQTIVIDTTRSYIIDLKKGNRPHGNDSLFFSSKRQSIAIHNRYHFSAAKVIKLLNTYSQQYYRLHMGRVVFER